MKLIMLALLCLLIFAFGCIGDAEATPESTVQNASLAPVWNATAPSVEKIEVIHFHGTHQCNSCIMVGQYAEETVNSFFKEELASGKLSFAHINGDLPENQELVRKYGVNSASLWIGVYDSEGNFKKEQNTQVWYLINDRDAYMQYLRGVLEAKLGDAS